MTRHAADGEREIRAFQPVTRIFHSSHETPIIRSADLQSNGT
jgi:hypothetical protein